MKDKGKQKIVITGASSNIGQSIFQELFKAHPDDVFILQCYKNPGSLKTLKEMKNREENLQIFPVDFRELDSLKIFLETIMETDILINAAAITKTGPLPLMDDSEMDQMIRVNIKAFTRICRVVIPGMVAKRSGCIVNISSVAATRGNRGQTIYAGTKGYVEAFTRSMAAEYGGKGVRVNCVAPGPIQGGTLDELLEYAPEKVKESIVARQIGSPQDVSHIVAFLCSDKATYFNGKTIGIDGGFMRGI